MHKLLFHLQVDFGEDKKFICNNHKDLEDYLDKNYEYHTVDIDMSSMTVRLKEWSNGPTEYATLEWIREF